jgi:hypothetical protein
MASSHIPTENQISIVLERSTFTGGDVVRGFLNLQLSKPLKSRKIFLKLEGKEHSVWEEQRGKHTKTIYNIHPGLAHAPRLALAPHTCDPPDSLSLSRCRVCPQCWT